MEAFALLLLPLLAVACCGLPLLIIGVVALVNRKKPRLQGLPSPPPLTPEQEANILSKNIN